MLPRTLAPAVALGLVLGAVAFSCGNDKLRRNTEPIQVVSGEPSVGQQLPGVQRGSPDAGPVIGGAAPYQVDSFTQPKVSKVDILWIIDDSNSMSPKQQRVKDNFLNFMKFLGDQQIDYHLGVVTTDTFAANRSGRLVNAAGLSKPWIDPSAGAIDGGAQVAFIANASVGTGGAGDEKGLLAGMLALTAPLEVVSSGGNCTSAECFLRGADTQLYTIIVSDEEDSSCAPIRRGGLGDGEGCDDAAASICTDGKCFGSIQYWSRFFSGAKGPGGVSKLAAITGTDSTFRNCKDIFAGYCDSYIAASSTKCVNAPDCTQVGFSGDPCCQALTQCSVSITDKAQWCELHQLNNGKTTGPFYRVSGVTYKDPATGNFVDLLGFPGCVASHVDPTTSQTVVDFTAYYAPRYVSVAQATGGIATSICDTDYTPAIEKLGLQASGLRSDFPLSRAPVDGSVAVSVNGVVLATGPTTWQYVKCAAGKPVNSIHFEKAALPPPNAKVAASYDVNVRGLTCP